MNGQQTHPQLASLQTRGLIVGALGVAAATLFGVFIGRLFRR